MIYIKSNEYNVTNNYNDKVNMILRSSLEANIKYVVTTLYCAIKKWDSFIKLIMFRAATLSKRSFIVEDVKCLLRELINQSMDNLSTLAAATNSELDDSSTQSLYSSSCKDVQQTPSLYERHMASIDGGSTLRSESHSLAVKQILACVWGQLVCLNKDSVCSK